MDYLSKNWNTNYSLLLKFKEHLKNAIYLPKNQVKTELYKFLPEILNIFKDLPSHWTSLNKESQISFTI